MVFIVKALWAREFLVLGRLGEANRPSFGTDGFSGRLSGGARLREISPLAPTRAWEAPAQGCPGAFPCPIYSLFQLRANACNSASQVAP